MRALTRRRFLGAAAIVGAAAVAGCGGIPGASRGRPWEGEPASTEGLWGFADMSGAWALPPRWHKAHGFVDGLAPVQHGDTAGATEADPPLVGLLGRDGEMAFEPVVGTSVGELSQGAFAFSTDWEGFSVRVYCGTDGRMITSADRVLIDACPFRPADALFGEPYAFASVGQWGALSLDGSWLMAPSFRGEVMDRLYDEPNEAGLLVASASSGHFKGSWGVADASGSWVVGPRYDGMERFVAGHGGLFAAFEEGGLWGALAQDCSVAVPAAYGGVDRLADADLWLAEDPESGLWGTLSGDLSGWEVSPRWSAYSSASSAPPSAGPMLARDGQTGLWGAASPGDGSWVVEPRWGGGDYPMPLGGLGPGLVSVADPEGGLWGVADASTGEWAGAPSFSRLVDLAPGLALARDPEGGLWGLVDASGSWALEPAFKELGCPGDDGLVPARSAE
ncbi:WG repeat-containing protein [Olsenella uli]|uniref:WG repeat-containing protein n=1 Tax=Olsenella uli TaxID=133926 RepID=UPI0028E5BE80|nr:WG repeat-containing protein [Olsenella uli]